VINKTFFNKARREYEYYVHCVNRDICQQTKTIFPPPQKNCKHF
jgi:hypothetical protein